MRTAFPRTKGFQHIMRNLVVIWILALAGMSYVTPVRGQTASPTSLPTKISLDNTKQLAQMGAMLANNGRNPATGEQVIREEDIPYILSAMTMAGLYDGSGGWAWHVGLPAKSGVGGAILAIAPGKGAIAVFGPRLDEAGNSVKAQKVITYVADKLDYNLFSPKSVGLK